MRTYGLTRRQSEVLDYIAKYVSENGFSPSYQEIMEHMGYSSKSRVHHVIKALVDRGYLKRIPNATRCLQVRAESTLEAAWNAATPTQRTAFEKKFFRGHSSQSYSEAV